MNKFFIIIGLSLTLTSCDNAKSYADVLIEIEHLSNDITGNMAVATQDSSIWVKCNYCGGSGICEACHMYKGVHTLFSKCPLCGDSGKCTSCKGEKGKWEKKQ